MNRSHQSRLSRGRGMMKGSMVFNPYEIKRSLETGVPLLEQRGHLPERKDSGLSMRDLESLDTESVSDQKYVTANDIMSEFKGSVFPESWFDEGSTITSMEPNTSHNVSNINQAIQMGGSLLQSDTGLELARDEDYQKIFLMGDKLRDDKTRSKDGVESTNHIMQIQSSIGSRRRLKNRFNVFFK